ncbi:MAG: 4Fe-4S dicluster domain-containing protein [Zavarzinella sp.]|nr:4Fe-4S dicluster domain-containing protein [Zavarzinella sp.]
MREIPVLDDTRCTGCGDCVAVCPAACLAMAGVIPWLIRPAACVSCAACVAVCPTDAVRLERPRPA